MIHTKYDRLENELVISLDKFTTFKADELPLVVEVKTHISGKPAWIAPLSQGSWISWKGGETTFDAFVKTANGKAVLEWKFNVELHGDSIEKMFYYYVKSNPKRTKGLVLGSHDGEFGHWTDAVYQDLCDVVLVDGSAEQFNKVKQKYNHLSCVKFVNEIITPNGGEVDWMQGGEGYTDTVRFDVIAKHVLADEITHTTRSSLGINELIEQTGGNFDWIHFDVEGLDGDLILALESEPELMIFETMHIKGAQYSELLDWFQEHNYKMFNDGSNAIAIKK